MKRKLLILLLAMMTALWAAGCGLSQEEASPEPQADPQQSQSAQQESPAIATGEETPDDPGKEAGVDRAEVKLYYVSAEYVFNGSDPVNGELMPAISGTVDRGSFDTIYMATLQALRALNPIPQDQTDKYYSMLRDSYKVNSVTVEDGIAYVDFASEGLTGGDLDEVLLIDQIVYTLCDSFTEIEAVKFTVDGQNAQSLMGNVDISEPIVADYL